MGYRNSKLNALSIEGNTKHDKAYAMWNDMTPMQRLEVMDKIGDYKQIARKYRACINYIAEYMV